jgi:hypothetical protein
MTDFKEKASSKIRPVTATLQVGESRPQSAALIQADQYNK